MTTPEADFDRRVTRAENDIVAICEMLGGIQRTVDQHTVTLAQHSALLHQHGVRLDRMDSRLERMDSRLERMDSRLGRVEHRLDEHGGILKEILRRLPAGS